MEELKNAVAQYTKLKRESLEEAADQKQIADSLKILYNHTEEIKTEEDFPAWVKKNLLQNIQEEEVLLRSKKIGETYDK